MENAVIGVFDDYSHARDAADAMVAAGFREWAVQVTPKEESMPARQSAMSERARHASSEGWSIGNFFRSLFGMDADHEHAHAYSEAVRRGSFLVTVEAEGDNQLIQATQILQQFHPIDIDERSAHWRSRGWSRYDPHSAPYDEHEIHLERSQYAAVAGAANPSVRSFRRTTGGASPGGGSDIGAVPGAIPGGGLGSDTRTGIGSAGATAGAGGSSAVRGDYDPTAAGVGRNSEDDIARAKSVGGGAGFGIDPRSNLTGSGPAAGASDAATGERPIGDRAVRESASHAADTSHLSSGNMRNAAMRDSTAPDIYTLDHDADYRTHWQKALGMEGRYEDIAPAYRFGAELRNNDNFKEHHDWNAIEPEVRRHWESGENTSGWEHASDAVRYGWEKAKR